MNYNLLPMLLETTEKQSSPIVTVIIIVVFVALIGYILYAQKKATNTIPKKISEKYKIIEKVQFGYDMLVISEGCFLIQENTKWYEFKADDIVGVENVYYGPSRQSWLKLYNIDGKPVVGKKILGGGVSGQMKSDFLYYTGLKDEKRFSQGEEAVKALMNHYPNIKR